ncbi:MAG: CbtA family protein [bacterium]
MFKRIVFAAAASGLVAGLVVSAVQFVRAVPLIYEAEKYEKKEPPPAQALGSTQKGLAPSDGEEQGGFSRPALTIVSNVMSAIGFALLLIAGFAIRGNVDWKQGVLWGMGGFIAFSLAPSIGLPPELPGSFAAALPDRQIWWIPTVAGTAVGLLLLAFKPGMRWKLAGVALIALPHIIGAPQPDRHGGLAPDDLMNAFVVAALVTSAIFWVALGAASAYFFNLQGGAKNNA